MTFVDFLKLVVNLFFIFEMLNVHDVCLCCCVCECSVKIHFVDQKGVKTTVQAPIGENILLVAHANDIDLEGACECSLACSTCHVYVDEENFVKLPEPAEEEEDMLDLAYGLTPLSRLGCQIIVTKELEGMTVTLPKATRNLQVDKK